MARVEAETEVDTLEKRLDLRRCVDVAADLRMEGRDQAGVTAALRSAREPRSRSVERRALKRHPPELLGPSRGPEPLRCAGVGE